MSTAIKILETFIQNELTRSGLDIIIHEIEKMDNDNSDYFIVHTKSYEHQTIFKVVGEDVFVRVGSSFFKVESNTESIRYFWYALLK